MPRRAPGKPLLLSFSTRGLFAPTWYAQHAAAEAGLSALDLDAMSPLPFWLAGRFGGNTPSYVPVRSVWISTEQFRSPAFTSLIASISERQPANPPNVVVTLPSSFALRDVMNLARAIHEYGEPHELMVGLPSGFLRGGRSHLVQLGGIRRLLEEWDVPLALDLSRKFDPTWEAEAAIARLGSHLRFLRMRVSAPARSAIGADRVACRTLLAALDRGWLTDLALCASGTTLVPLLLPARGTHSYRSAIEFIQERQLSYAAALRQGISHFEGSPSPRNN